MSLDCLQSKHKQCNEEISFLENVKSSYPCECVMYKHHGKDNQKHDLHDDERCFGIASSYTKQMRNQIKMRRAAYDPMRDTKHSKITSRCQNIELSLIQTHILLICFQQNIRSELIVLLLASPLQSLRMLI